MFTKLSESIKKTISIADGWNLGRLVFEGENYEKPLIKLENGDEIEVLGLEVDVLNDGEWHTMTEDYYRRKTAEGWPLFGGFDCRFKAKE